MPEHGRTGPAEHPTAPNSRRKRVHDGDSSPVELAPASAAEPIAPWEPPGYADPDTFDEQDLMVGSGPLAVPGTLSLPRQSGPRAAVVLLAGSGGGDRDETMGRNKPLKDLAWGLASRGVAVLRFDKVTYAHPNELKEALDITAPPPPGTYVSYRPRLPRNGGRSRIYAYTAEPLNPSSMIPHAAGVRLG